jgi:hypothetical protein
MGKTCLILLSTGQLIVGEVSTPEEMITLSFIRVGNVCHLPGTLQHWSGATLPDIEASRTPGRNFTFLKGSIAAYAVIADDR